MTAPGGETELHRMSHALRASVQRVLLDLQSLSLTLPADVAVDPVVGDMRQELLRCGRLLQAAFTVLSLEVGDVATVNLRTVVGQALAAPDLERVVVEPGSWPDVRGDTRLLALAIEHLARNAWEATSPGRRPPRIACDVRRNGHVDLLVRDWGRGFGPGAPGRRAFTSTRADHVAMGLLTAERIARLHDGRLSFGTARQGTEVRLSLPPAGPGVRTRGGTAGSRGRVRRRPASSR